MKYRYIGGMQVSQFALGTWHLPPSSKKDEQGILYVDVEKSNRIFRKAQDLGINFYDTANTYHGTISETHLHPEHSGNAERILGDFLKGYERESYVVATKVRAEVARFPNGGGLSRKHISWQIKQSLSRLKLDFVDLYQIHWQDPNTPAAETMDILNDLVHRGIVHYLGTSNHPPESTIEMLKISRQNGWESFLSMQESYNILDREVEDQKARIAKENKMAILAYVPLAEGILTGKYLNGIPSDSRAGYTEGFRKKIESSMTQVKRISEIASEMHITPSQLALAWLLKKQEELGVSIIPILGATDEKHLESNIEALNIRMPEDTFKQINELR